MKYNYKIVMGMLICLVSIVAKSQTVRGVVVDMASRQPLQYVHITDESNAAQNTFTDQYGHFRLRGNTAITRLLVSCAGYKPVIVSVESKAEIKIEMQPDFLNLKDVAVLNSNALSNFGSLAKVDLDLKPVKNTQELLRMVPGLFIAQHAGGGKAEQIFLRGFDVDHGTDVKISVDGLPVNMVSHAHGQGYADLHFVIPETINTIDFGAGPYYTGHGDFNTAGYVALSTFKSIPKSTIQVEGGRFNTVRTLLMIDLLKKNKDLRSAYVAGDFNYSDGPTIDKQRFKRLNLFGKYNTAIRQNTQLSASASLFTSSWDASGQIPDRATEAGLIDRFGSIDPTEGGNTQRYNANIILVSRYANGGSWENQAYYSRNIFNLYSNFTFFLNDPVNGDGINQKEKRNIFGYSSTYNQKKYFGKVALSSTYAAGVRYDASRNSRLASTAKRQFLTDIMLGNVKQANVYAYMQYQLSRSRWLVDAGVRLDHFHFRYLDKIQPQSQRRRSASIVSPKLNIQYTLNKHLQFFVKGGKGFHSNDARVVVQRSGEGVLPAAYGVDAGVILKPTDKLYLNIAAWYLYLQQEFVYVGDAGIVELSGKTKRKGIDVIARYQFTRNLFANVNYNFTEANAIGEPKDADRIPLAPVATSTGGVFYKAQKGINGGLSYRYIKDRPANEDNSIIAKGYFLLDASINYTRQKYEVGLAFENILNAEWNEAQFATESRLQNETDPVEELHYTPGIPFYARLKVAIFF